MPNRSADILYQLIKSLEKAEKRHFKLYIKRSSAREDLKVIKLFDAIDRGKDYDEKLILKKLPGVEKPQFANLKMHLYKELLASLRLLKSADSIDLQLHEQLDYASILYNKGLYLHAVHRLGWDGWVWRKGSVGWRCGGWWEQRLEGVWLGKGSKETTARKGQVVRDNYGRFSG